MGIDINLFRACIGMFNNYKLYRQKVSNCSLHFFFYLLILLLYYYIRIYLIPLHIVMHRKSLNIKFFIYQLSLFMSHISILIYLSGDIETNQVLLQISLKVLKFVIGTLIAYQPTILLKFRLLKPML